VIAAEFADAVGVEHEGKADRELARRQRRLVERRAGGRDREHPVAPAWA
jgi:hypothetical protein